jgi:hypothetical protein
MNHRRLPSLLLLMLLVACSGEKRQEPREIIDERSAATLLIVAAPYVFARSRSDVAAHERDYATLVAVEIDASGQFAQYLLVYRWSTVDRRVSSAPNATAANLRIIGDGRVINLTPVDPMPIGLAQRRQLHVPDHGDIVAHAYRVDTAALRFIAASRQLSVRLPQEELDAPFALWEDGRRALSAFLQRAGEQ